MMNAPRLSRRGLLAGAALSGAGAAAAGLRDRQRAGPLPGLSPREPLLIAEQGSFAVGGTVVRSPGRWDPADPASGGQTLHADHGYVTYQLPVGARALPLVFWHGTMQFSKTWETTPDGREGFQTLFLRRRHGVYLITQPRRGNAGRTSEAAEISTQPDERRWFGVFRLGIWPDFFPEVQFSRDPAALDQYFRQITPNTGPFDLRLVASAAGALFRRIGDGVLVTHSESGGPGWRTVIETPEVKGVVAYEPGSNFVFPEGEVPSPIPSSAGPLSALGVPIAEFMALTRIPILIVYGDNIPAEPSANSGADGWRARLEMARLWRDAVNARGGTVEVVHLPEIGIRGNTHFPFSDLNNVVVADHMSAFLRRHGLDR